VPSLAYARWVEFVADPLDLVGRLQGALDGGEPDPYCLARATVVSLAAAWETYVEHVAVETAQYALLPPVLPQFRAQVRQFHNATSENVQALFLPVLGHDLWPHVAVSGKTVGQTRLAVNTNQNTRHAIAHGQDRPRFSVAALAERIAFFRELVANVDQYLSSHLAGRLGRHPW